MKLMENLITDHPVVLVRIQNRPVAAARVLTLARHRVTLVHDVGRLHVTTVIQETLVAQLRAKEVDMNRENLPDLDMNQETELEDNFMKIRSSILYRFRIKTESKIICQNF